jgi:hypothetical protein
VSLRVSRNAVGTRASGHCRSNSGKLGNVHSNAPGHKVRRSLEPKMSEAERRAPRLASCVRPSKQLASARAHPHGHAMADARSVPCNDISLRGYVVNPSVGHWRARVCPGGD